MQNSRDSFEKLSDKLDSLNAENEKLKKLIEGIAPEREFYKQKSKDCAEFPTETGGVADWINTKFKNTIYLHKNAVNSLKKYDRPINMPVLCDGIYFISAYAEFRQGRISADELALYAEQCSWEVQGCGKETLKMLRNDYIVKINNENFLLDLHIKNGVNPQNWVRIYFCWNENMNKIVIGYMPDHLPTVSDKT